MSELVKMASEPLNFLIVLPTAVLGGAERVMFNFAEGLLSEGHQVTIYAMSRGNQRGWESLRSYKNFNLIARNFRSEKTSLIAFVCAMRKLSRENEYYCIISSHSHVNAALSILKRVGFIRCRFLVARESTVIFERFRGMARFLFWFLYRFCYGAQDLLICQTEHMKVSLINNLGFQPAKRISSIPNPVSISHIKRLLKNPVADDFSKNQLIVACGRLIPLKNFEGLVEAFAAIASAYPRAKLAIIGDGPEKRKLQDLVISLKINDRVKFLGRLENPIAWFAKADVGVISSIREGFPNVLIEMMASGTRNIITTPCSEGVHELPAVTVLESSSSAALADALDKALKEPSDNSTDYCKHVNLVRTSQAFWSAIHERLFHAEL